MPIYEYHCKSCGKNLEITQKILEAPKKKCPECGGKLEKLMSATSFALKGTGWYKTDYAAKTPNKEEKKEGKKEEKKEEKKPAASEKTSSKPSGESKPAESKPASTSAK